MENNMNQNGNQNEMTKLTIKDKIKGIARRTFTWKNVLGAAAFGTAVGAGIGYAVGHHNKDNEPAIPEEPAADDQKAEKPVEELYGINDEQLAEIGLKYEPDETPVENTAEEKEVEA